jgi:hypothetical protein
MTTNSAMTMPVPIRPRNGCSMVENAATANTTSAPMPAMAQTLAVR